MTIKQAVLAGNARAWGRISDFTRERGGTYEDAYAWVCRIFTDAGRAPPSRQDFEEKMLEADEAEGASA